MYKPLIGEKIAVLVANGFCEHDLTQVQRALQGCGANIRIISMDHGLVNSWNGTGWGLHYASDQVLSAALAADYSMLIVPGGQRSVEKLKLTAHSRRFIKGFLDSRKPVAIFGEALELLIFSGQIAGKTVAGPGYLKEEAEQEGAVWSQESYAIDDMLITGDISDEERAAYVNTVSEFFISSFEMSEAA